MLLRDFMLYLVQVIRSRISSRGAYRSLPWRKAWALTHVSLLQERERWLSATVGETLHVDPAQINALRVYSSTSDFEKGVAKHVHSVLYDEYVVIEAMQPYAVRHDGNAVCLPDVIALPDGQLQ